MQAPRSQDEEPLSDAERALAARLRVDTDFVDWQDRHVEVRPRTVRGVLTALGADVSTPQRADETLDRLSGGGHGSPVPPCVVLRQGGEREVAVEGADAWLELEAGVGRVALPLGRQPDGSATVTIPADTPLGYHRLVVRSESEGASGHVIVVPMAADLDSLLGGNRAWGLTAQLYSDPSQSSWAIGDLHDLATLATWSAGEHGANFVVVNPLSAAQPTPPMEPSPYLPSSRLYANPVYLRVEDVPEYTGLPPTSRRRHEQRAASLRTVLAERDRIDRDEVWAAKRAALQEIFEVAVSPDRQQAMTEFAAREGSRLVDFATWCTLAEVYGTDWTRWPEELRRPGSAAVYEFAARWSARVSFHVWLQFLLDEQLANTQASARAAGMRLGVVHDLAVGVHPTGADAWMLQDCLAEGVSVGAPPDAFNQVGQEWSQPPWRPDALERRGYEPFRQLVAGLLRHAGGLRIDHVIGLFRLWWIPKGRPPSEGTYVHYDHEALLGILLLEADRAGAVLIGEDLGNVQESARATLHERGILGTSVLWFERGKDGRPRPPEAWRLDCLAAVTTHDLPPTLGYLLADHVRLRERLGLLTRSADDELADAEAERARWLTALQERGLVGDHPTADELVEALHAFVASTPARLVCVAWTDAVGERRAQNQPGTSDEYPNWRIPLHGPDGAQLPLEHAIRSARVQRLLQIVGKAVSGPVRSVR